MSAGGPGSWPGSSAVFQHTTRPRRYSVVKPPVVIAALSGASALIFENLWFRSASIALGSSASSSAIVLSAFMLGLAIGSVGCLRFESRLRRPMQAYASIEVVIALTGLMALVLLPRTSSWLAPAFSQLATSPAAVNALRLAVSFTLLVVPAAAMGATLPVLMHAITGAREDLRRETRFRLRSQHTRCGAGDVRSRALACSGDRCARERCRRRFPQPRGGRASSTRES